MNLIKRIIEAIMNSPPAQIPAMLKLLGNVIETAANLTEVFKDRKQTRQFIIALRRTLQVITDQTNSVVGALKSPTLSEIQALIPTLETATFLHPFEKRFLLMHLTGIIVNFAGEGPEGKLIIFSSDDFPTKKKQESNVETPTNNKTPDPVTPDEKDPVDTGM